MTVNSKKLTSTLVVLTLGLLALGFSWADDSAMSASSYPTLTAPDTALAGSQISIYTSSDVGRLRIVIEDGLGNTLYDSEESLGSYGQLDPTTGLYHLDISYINFRGTFVYLVCLIDGFSRYIVHFELRTSVEALDIEILMERARSKYPGESPVLITDNGPQFIAKELKVYLKEVGITHRRTRFFYPQSNGKIERFYQTCKNELIRRNSFLTLDDLKTQLDQYIKTYNTQRLHSSIGYITPRDMLLGNQKRIFNTRKRKLELARQERIKQRNKIAA